MRSNYITLAALGLLIPLFAQAQTYTQQYLERNGRTYDSARSSLESQGYQGQYGTYLYTTTSGRSSLGGVAGSSKNGTQLGTNPYRAYRYGSESQLDGGGSYQLGSGGGTLGGGFSGAGRTGGSM